MRHSQYLLIYFTFFFAKVQGFSLKNSFRLKQLKINYANCFQKHSPPPFLVKKNDATVLNFVARWYDDQIKLSACGSQFSMNNFASIKFNLMIRHIKMELL